MGIMQVRGERRGVYIHVRLTSAPTDHHLTLFDGMRKSCGGE